MSSTSSWRLSARITYWCLAVGTGFVAVLAVLGCVLEHFETQEELDAVVTEELGEMIASFATTPGTRADFLASAEDIRRLHPDDNLAWRVWSRGDGAVWSSFGREDLLERMPARATAEADIGGSSRWRTGSMGPDLDLGLLLEGGRAVEGEQEFAIIAFSTVVGAAGLSFLAGRFLGRRIGGALQGIAEETRAGAQRAAFVPEAPGLPDEMRDVTAALQESLARIHAESDRTRLLASGLAHELRSPLQNLLMQAEVALLRERSMDEYRGALSKQIHDLQELIRAVDNLVTLCAPPAARKALFDEAFDLVAEARLRLRGEEARAERDGVQLRASMPESLTYRGDRESLMLALRNLVANAIDWSPRGGRVDVRILDGEHEVVVEVADQGPGVPASERARIFEPFERGPARPDGRAGYGLGLALVRTVADLHHGTIQVGSSTLGGASFRLALPRPVQAGLAPVAVDGTG